MKKFGIILVYILICFSMFSGCTEDKGNGNPGGGLGNSVDVDIDGAAKGSADISLGDDDISFEDDDIVFDFKDPENADGIVATPKE